MSEPATYKTGHDMRRAAREGFSGATVGQAAGYAQANIFIVSESAASAFAAFCAANPAACPLMACGRPGEPGLPGLGPDIDIRTDLPAYRIHEAGQERVVPDITEIWRPDSVVFAIGCWLGAEGALAAAGIRMRHRELRLQGGLYRTKVSAADAGGWTAPLVVSMRPFARRDLETITAITARMPFSHGAPLPVGDPAELGIDDLASADWGDPVLPEPGEIPVFWPCGLTALAALETAGLPFFISHAPGAMLVTDLKELDLS